MNQEDLRERLDAIQTQLMNLYESSPTDLQSQIKHYQLLRKECAIQYYAKKEGYNNLGLQHLPPTRVSEHNSKQAIKMSILLESLAKSPYANEEWTLTETSADRLLSPPRNCFKKQSFEVEVWFDQNPNNAFPYINWEWIYYQDENDEWHKVKGRTDYNGLYFVEVDGTVSYFLLFEKDANRYGQTGMWTVNVKNKQILPPSVGSSARRSVSESQSNGTQSPFNTQTEETVGGRQIPQEAAGPSSTTTSPKRGQRRRRGGEGEQTTNKRRRRAEGRGGTADITAEEVGQSHRSVPAAGLTRVERLKAEARDPPLVLIKGCANKLKCWRYRCEQKCPKPYSYMTSVFKWITNDVTLADSRLLVAFHDSAERAKFLASVSLPKGSKHCLGNIESL